MFGLARALQGGRHPYVKPSGSCFAETSKRASSARFGIDMDEEETPGIPKHHVHFSELTGACSQNVHAPSGAVTIEQVLDMIVREFFWTRTNLASLGVAT